MTKITDRCWEEKPESNAPFFVVHYEPRDYSSFGDDGLCVFSSLGEIREALREPRCLWAHIYEPLPDGLKFIWKYRCDDGINDYGWMLPDERAGDDIYLYG